LIKTEVNKSILSGFPFFIFGYGKCDDFFWQMKGIVGDALEALSQ
jgi:hypothetical protein